MEKREKVTLKNGSTITFLTVERSDRKFNIINEEMLNNIEWYQFFDESFNNSFSNYVTNDDEHAFRVDDEGNIGIWLTLHDTKTDEEYTGWLYKECAGTLMVALYIMMQCMKFVNADGHIYNFMTNSGVAAFYNRFIELMKTDSEPSMRSHTTYIGGYTEAMLNCHGYTAEDVFEILDECIQ